jgi:hypothetical protein
MRRLKTRAARTALEWARHAARRAGIPGLMAEVDNAFLALDAPAAQLIARGQQRPLLLEEVEALQASPALVVDALRYLVRQQETMVSLATRPVLFALARTLAEAWPADVSRATLIAQAFGGTLRCWPCLPMVNPGRVLRWRWPLAPASAACSGRWSNSARPARCSRSGTAGRAAG